jgi:hypothetical protein
LRKVLIDEHVFCLSRDFPGASKRALLGVLCVSVVTNYFYVVMQTSDFFFFHALRSTFYLPFFVEARRDNDTENSKDRPDHEVDHIVVPQVDG